MLGIESSIWPPMAGVISRTAVAVSFGCTYGASADTGSFLAIQISSTRCLLSAIRSNV